MSSSSKTLTKEVRPPTTFAFGARGPRPTGEMTRAAWNTVRVREAGPTVWKVCGPDREAIGIQFSGSNLTELLFSHFTSPWDSLPATSF